MNIDTGEIFRDINLEKALTPIPLRHNKEALGVLGNQNSAFIDEKEHTPLVKWMLRKRAAKKKLKFK